MIEIETDIPLKEYTTFKVGGPAEFFAVVRDEGELREALEFAKNKELPVTILGGGSNLLVVDDGVKGLVIKNEIESFFVEETGDAVLVTAGSGMNWDELVARTVEEGWWGLENLSHIPGTVGATPVQNVGAYGVEVGDSIVSVAAIDLRTGEQKEFANDECRLEYRDSFFKSEEGRNFFITAVIYRLRKNGQPQISYRDLTNYFADRQSIGIDEVRQAVIEIRSRKFPDWKNVGTAGSFFKNPVIAADVYEELKIRCPELPGYPTLNGQVKVPLGWILDKVINVRGWRDGDVGAYEGQALVLVNYGGATASEVEKFANEIAVKVYAATGIDIEWEVTKW